MRGRTRAERDLPGGGQGQSGAEGDGDGPRHGAPEGKTADSSHEIKVQPTNSTSYEVEVADISGGTASSSADVTVEIVQPQHLSSQGPLAQALAELWDKARQAKVNAIGRLVVTFYDAAATWKVHQAMATIRDAEVNCSFEVAISAEGVNAFDVKFDGRLDKANVVKSFLDPQLRSAADHDFTATYTLSFPAPLSTTADKVEAFARSMTRYGSGEAYVEAHAAPPEASR
jgi:hypothetical protein